MTGKVLYGYQPVGLFGNVVRVHALGNQKPEEQRFHIGNQFLGLLLCVEAAHDQIGLRANGPGRKNVYLGKTRRFPSLPGLPA